MREAEAWAYVRALLGVALFGPVLTVLVVWGKGAALRAYGRAGGRAAKLRLLSLLATAQAEDAETASRLPPVARLRRQATSSGNLRVAAGLSARD